MSPLFGIDPSPDVGGPPAPRRRWLGLVGAVAALSIVGLVIYTGAAGLKGRRRLEAEGFADAVKPEYESDERALVVEVYDGDTVRLADGRHVRYLGIDTPETAKPHLGVPEGDPYAKEAEDFNRALVLGKEVGLIYGLERLDHYGRTLACIIVNDPGTGEKICVNAQLLRQGLARAYILDRHFQFRKWFLKLQAQAKREQVGIWSL